MDFLLEQAAFCLMNGRYTPLSCFHLFIATMYLAGLYGYYDVSRKASTGAPEEYAGFWKYLTYWNLVFHFVFFAISSIIDIITSECDAYDSILWIRDTAFASIVFPYGMFVFLMFWGIYISNRDKIFRKEDEQNFPAWLNHISHTVALPVVLLESFVINHQFPSTIQGYTLTACLGGAYLLWVLYLGLVKDIWVYIFLKELGWKGRVRFFIVSFVIAFVVYVVGEKTNYFLWGDLYKVTFPNVH